VLFALIMVAVIVGVDVLFFRGRTWFWERLATNVGIVRVFGAFYLGFSEARSGDAILPLFGHR
jgi:hypothetical protein